MKNIMYKNRFPFPESIYIYIYMYIYICIYLEFGMQHFHQPHRFSEKLTEMKENERVMKNSLGNLKNSILKIGEAAHNQTIDYFK